ncbi:MAG: fibronectin type III domain-containing protein [Chlorobi bacterium OLB7]|nr:MAG: fibronectin type III domain-containing protein [Chlorobi bacterium OLB7]
MNKNQSNQLDDLFAQAKQVPLLPSEGRIRTIINNGSINNGSGTSGRRLQTPTSRSTTKRATTMTLTILGLAGLLGIGTLYFGPTESAPELQKSELQTIAAPSLPATAQKPMAMPLAVAPAATQQSAPAAQSMPRYRGNTPNGNQSVQGRDTLPTQTDKQRDALANKFTEQIGGVFSQYWLNKINGYKRQIDAMLSPDDLARLNRMRIRWSLTDGGLSTMLHASAGENFLSFHLGVSSKPSTETTPEKEKNMKEEMEGMDPMMMLPFIRQMMLQDTSESGKILAGAIDLSEGYRPGLDNLRDQVLRDFSEFIDLVANQASTFVDQNKDQLSKEDREKVATIREKITEGIGEIKNQQKLLTAIYGLIFEPVLMLYNGSDINGLISSAITEPVAGLKLSENQTLKQSIPNPATGNVAIGYTLAEPSQRTVLRVFDAAGNVVATADQGSRPAGNHTIALDVSTWKNGTYLYHLTTQTSNGEQVFSKTMQVVK